MRLNSFSIVLNNKTIIKNMELIVARIIHISSYYWVVYFYVDIQKNNKDTFKRNRILSSYHIKIYSDGAWFLTRSLLFAVSRKTHINTLFSYIWRINHV